MKISPGNDEGEFVLELTPMIDVVFLLLIFFMLATTFLDPEREIELELPQADSATELSQEPDEIVLNVLSDGRVFFVGDGDTTQMRATLMTRGFGVKPNKKPEAAPAPSG